MEFKTNYNSFHKDIRLQRHVITKKDFTYRNILKILEKYLLKKTDVLDIGCGAGNLAFFLANLNNFVTGVDISAKAIESCKTNSLSLGLEKNTNFLKKDFPKESINGKFDLIICSEVLEHIEDEETALRKIHLMLKDSGLVLISVPSSNSPLYRWKMSRKFDKEVGHLRRYTSEEITRKLESLDFDILEIHLKEGILRNFLFLNTKAGRLIRFIKGPISDLVTFFDHLLIPLFGEADIIIVARKK